jgi:mannose-6-phosphate isomerase-like protein (cupin superfamily)
MMPECKPPAQCCVTNKPWGSYTDYFRDDNVVFKTIEVSPKQRLSLQTHEERAEIWVVMEGECLCEINENVRRLGRGETLDSNWIFIQQGDVHRLINDTTEKCVIAELQFGKCSEQDIVRLEDDYNRTKPLFSSKQSVRC